MGQAKTRDYSLNHKVEYGGEHFVFDPYWSGLGIWKHFDTKRGTPGKIAKRDLQLILNEIVFGDPELPNMMDRFAHADRKERERLKEISESWLQLKVKGIKHQITGRYLKTVNTFDIGHMYFYLYDAKHKATLPVWDKFPLMIPIEMYPNGWLGLNLHFLDSGEKAEILEHMIKAFGYYEGEYLRLNINYRSLRRLEYFEELSPCIKHYLTSNIQSRILPVEPHEWAYAIWLPAADMQYNKKKNK